MEFMLSGQGGQLRLPVPPTDFTLQSGNINQIVNVVRQGEINLWGPERLDGITIQSFFPAKYAPYCKYEGFPSPWNCVKTIDDWRNSGKPVRLIIVDSELGVDINMLALIESFDKTMRDHTGDVYFSITLKKYKIIGQADSYYNSTGLTRDIPPGRSSNDLFTPVFNFFSGNNWYMDESGAFGDTITYTGKAGEDLWDIAKDKLGIGSAWQKIYNDNKNKLQDAISSVTGIKLDIKLPF